MNDTSIQRSDQDSLSSVLRRKTLPPPTAQPRPTVDAAIVRSDAARLTTVVQRKPSAAAQRLAAHARHHSAAHMAAMRRLLQQGVSFEAAHARAMASVGR